MAAVLQELTATVRHTKKGYRPLYIQDSEGGWWEAVTDHPDTVAVESRTSKHSRCAVFTDLPKQGRGSKAILEIVSDGYRFCTHSGAVIASQGKWITDL